MVPRVHIDSDATLKGSEASSGLVPRVHIDSDATQAPRFMHATQASCIPHSHTGPTCACRARSMVFGFATPAPLLRTKQRQQLELTRRITDINNTIHALVASFYLYFCTNKNKPKLSGRD